MCDDQQVLLPLFSLQLFAFKATTVGSSTLTSKIRPGYIFFFWGGVKGATKAIKVSREEDKKPVILSKEQALEEENAILRANLIKMLESLKPPGPSVKW